MDARGQNGGSDEGVNPSLVLFTISRRNKKCGKQVGLKARQMNHVTQRQIQFCNLCIGSGYRVMAACVNVNVGDAKSGSPQQSCMYRHNARKVSRRQLEHHREDKARHHQDCVVKNKSNEEHIIVANGDGLMQGSNRSPGPRGRSGEELMDPKKSIDFKVLPPPNAVGTENRGEQADKHEEKVSQCEPH